MQTGRESGVDGELRQTGLGLGLGLGCSLAVKYPSKSYILVHEKASRTV